MFKGTVHFYKNVDGKEKEILKTCYDENEFDTFINSNIDISTLDEFSWEMTRWPSLSNLRDFYREKKKIGNTDDTLLI